MIRIGIIGTGGAGHSHAKHYSKLQDARVVACYDIDHERAAAFSKKFSIEHACTHFEDFMGRVDAVSITTPDDTHASLALACFERDLHVLCEKPLTTTLDDAATVAAAARQATSRGVVHMTNFSKRNHPQVTELCSVVRSGRLGEITHVRGGYDQSWIVQDAWGPWTNDTWTWRLSRPGGVLIDIGVHVFDLLVAAVGPPSKLRCSLSNFPKPLEGSRADQHKGTPLDADDIAHQEILLESGAIAHLTQSRWASGYHDRVWLEVFGTTGAAAIDLERHPDELLLCEGRESLRERKWASQKHPGLNTKQADFVHAIVTGTQAEPSIVHGARIQSYIDAAQRSAESQTWQEPADIEAVAV